jgi:predicted HicB family RNase H-like nuclease
MTKDDTFLHKCQSFANGKIRAMAKDSRLTFRVPSELKRLVEVVAHNEGRSVGQVCEAFLRAGLERHKKDGGKSLRIFVSRKDQQD